MCTCLFSPYVGGAHIFKKCISGLEIVDAWRATRSKLITEDPQILVTTVQHSVVLAT